MDDIKYIDEKISRFENIESKIENTKDQDTQSLYVCYDCVETSTIKHTKIHFFNLIRFD